MGDITPNLPLISDIKGHQREPEVDHRPPGPVPRGHTQTPLVPVSDHDANQCHVATPKHLWCQSQTVKVTQDHSLAPANLKGALSPLSLLQTQVNCHFHRSMW